MREIFAAKLHKGLGRGLPFKCLPLDFMGMYALAGLEADERMKSKIYDYVLKDINRRREYARNLTQGSATCMMSYLIVYHFYFYKCFNFLRFN